MKKATYSDSKGNPMISVIIPVYNVEKYLKACLDSVLNQTFSDYEIICVNDGSADSSPAILADYQRKGILVITQENQGLSVARNVGAAHARGQYVYFLDSDDTIHPQMLACLYAWVTRFDADLAVCQLQRVRQVPTTFDAIDCDRVRGTVTTDPLRLLGDKGRFHIPVNACIKLYKKSLIVDLAFIPGIYFEDFPFAVCLMKKHPKTVVSRLPLYFYMENQSSITHSNWTVKKLTDYCVGLEAIIACYQDSPKEFAYISKHIFPKVIKQAFNSIFRRMDDPVGLVQVLQVYQRFFIHLNEKGGFSYKGHKLSRYWAYRRLMKAKDVAVVIPMMKRIFK